jgi:hypothetical protein
MILRISRTFRIPPDVPDVYAQESPTFERAQVWYGVMDVCNIVMRVHQGEYNVGLGQPTGVELHQMRHRLVLTCTSRMSHSRGESSNSACSNAHL